MRRHWQLQKNDFVRYCGLILTFPLFLGSSPAYAADCGAIGISAKFGEAASWCGASDGAAGRPAPGLIDMPRSVSISMPAARVARLAAALSRSPTRQRALPDHALIQDVAVRYRIDPALLAAMVRAESGGRMNAVSHKGALGLMQVMPATARSMGVSDPSSLLGDPALALETGARYLKTLQGQFGNDVPLIVAAYNAGPGAVTKAGMRVPAYRETQAYVGRVMGNYLAALSTPTATR